MSAVAPPLDAETLLRRVREEGHVVIRGVSWDAYKRLMDSFGERSVPHAYDRGSLELMPKSNEHEVFKSLLGRLIEIWADENDTPFSWGGEMTLQREDIERGVEGDECDWVGNLARLGHPLRIDLSRDPPPDLVIEAEVSTTAVDKLGIYAALGVPEVWRVSAARIRVGRLQADGQYQWGEQSGVFPALPLAEVLHFFQQVATTNNHLSIVRALRAWVRQQLGR